MVLSLVSSHVHTTELAPTVCGNWHCSQLLGPYFLPTELMVAVATTRDSVIAALTVDRDIITANCPVSILSIYGETFKFC